MAYNHLFCSALNINVYLEYNAASKVLKKSIGFVGSIGLLAGTARFIMLSIMYNWWWFIAGTGILLFGIGLFSYLFRSKTKDILGMFNILFIPFFWWYTSRFNTILSINWFYDLVDGIRNMFA